MVLPNTFALVVGSLVHVVDARSHALSIDSRVVLPPVPMGCSTRYQAAWITLQVDLIRPSPTLVF